MPNHWESSGRPLFVKTVFVNGNRHAILSQTDPLLHGTTTTLKKKRPGSVLSTESFLSLTSSESQESGYEKKSKSLKPQRSYVEEDISSQLQRCLIKLRLASSNQNHIKSKKKLDFNDSREQMNLKGFEKTSSKQKRKKLNIKSDNNYSEGFGKENHQQELKKETHNCSYVYNYENFKGKKNYCFVKITSQPSHFILKCSCDKNWGKNQNCCGSKEFNCWNKNNLVISATFHNLSMSAELNEEQSQNFSNLFSMESLDSCELYWNNSQSKQHYNSLSDRVIQWLDLANKRQNPEIVSSMIEDVSNNIKRIFSGRMYEEVKSASEKSIKIEKAAIKRERERIAQREPDFDVETEVKVEDNIETALSIEKLQMGFAEWEEILSGRKVARSEIIPVEKIIKKNSESMSGNNEKLEMISIPTKNDQNLSITTYLKNSIANHLNTSKSPVSMNVEELLLDAREALKKIENQKKKKKAKSKQDSIRQTKFQEPEEEEENEEICEDEDFKITTIKYWKTKIKKRNDFNESMTLQSNRQTGDCIKQIKNRNLKGEFEKYKKSIDNPNITQTRPTSHNLSSPQQFNKIPFSHDEKSVWPTDKYLRKPQLHIFIPNVLSKEPSEDSVSECESFLEVS